MPRAIKSTSVKRGKWARYNASRRNDREADRRKRAANRAARIAAAEARAIAEFKTAPPIKPPPRRPQLRARFTVEVLQPDGSRERHQFTTTWCPYFRAWSVPASRITQGIAAIMARAPEIPHHGT